MKKETYRVAYRTFSSYLEAAEFKKANRVADFRCSENFLKIYTKDRLEPLEQSQWESLDDSDGDEQFYGQG
jgi:hypothetical protein